MKKTVKFISLILCAAIVFCLYGGPVLATSQADIDRLKEQQASDEAVLEALTARINELSAKIQGYNNEINRINGIIEENNAEIERLRQETEADKLKFQKRIRAIYMSNSESTVKILMGAKSFSQFLQLAQLTASVSAHDKKLMEDLSAKMKKLSDMNAENQKLLDEQKAVKADLDKDYAELERQQAEAQAIYDKTTGDLEEAEAAYEAEQEEMRRRAQQGGSGNWTPPQFQGSMGFVWPSVCYYISAGYQSNDSVHNGTHNGIDIAGSGIMGTPIYAIADGYVTYSYNGCTHNYGKYYGCGCGGNYGNYCQINHGTINGNNYSAVYGHATSIIVSTGEFVSQGQIIGYVGTTGWSTGPHLHLGLYENGYYVDPLWYF